MTVMRDKAAGSFEVDQSTHVMQSELLQTLVDRTRHDGAAAPPKPLARDGADPSEPRMGSLARRLGMLAVAILIVAVTSSALLYRLAHHLALAKLAIAPSAQLSPAAPPPTTTTNTASVPPASPPRPIAAVTPATPAPVAPVSPAEKPQRKHKRTKAAQAKHAK
jgi:hypothetical protein